jgi:uroporphyrinogen decarboxylase
MPMFLSFPVQDRESWEDYKKRLNPYNLRRYPKDWNKDAYIETFENYQQGATILYISGFYGFGAQLMGVPTFISMFYKDPELIEDMLEHWEFYTTETVKDAIETLNERIDIIFWWEDMAEKHGPCISPKLYREYLLPCYKRVTNFFKKRRIDRIMMDSDGNITPLLNLIIEGGITGLWPLEVNAGMNALNIKKEYDRKLFMIGNLDKRELSKGGERMQIEVDSKVPQLKKLGGYIPGVDHLVHVEFTLSKFKEYSNYIKTRLPY